MNKGAPTLSRFRRYLCGAAENYATVIAEQQFVFLSSPRSFAAMFFEPPYSLVAYR